MTWHEPEISEGSLGEPDKQEPTRTIEAKEHKNATADDENDVDQSEGKVDRMVRNKHLKIPSGFRRRKFPITGVNRYETGQNQYPANDSDGERAFHQRLTSLTI
jgi:hypothetical protein